LHFASIPRVTKKRLLSAAVGPIWLKVGLRSPRKPATPADFWIWQIALVRGKEAMLAELIL
jgi:hypothetical protein